MSITETKAWFEKAVPEPTSKNIHTQLGVFSEEVCELLSALKGADRITQAMLTDAIVSMHALSMHLKNKDKVITVVDRKELLDGICDVIVTAVGTAHVYDMNVVKALDAVNASNYSKFVDGKPLFDDNMKIKKGPNYHKPCLDQCY